MMKTFKKIITVLLVVLTVMSCFTMFAAAASTQKSKIVSWSALNPSSAPAKTVTYTIKGNWLTQKKVTVKVGSSSANFNFDSGAINFYKNNACFRVDIYKNGTWQRAYTGKLGQSFKLPKGSSNYTVVMKTYYSNWNGNSSTCRTAALGGSYYLEY